MIKYIYKKKKVTIIYQLLNRKNYKIPILLLILFTIIIGFISYKSTEKIQFEQYKHKLESIPAKGQQSPARINSNDVGSRNEFPSAPPEGISKLGDIIFDSQDGFDLPVIDASFGYNGMFYSAEPQSDLYPKNPKKDAVILASHTTFNYYFGQQLTGFGLLHYTKVGYKFTLKYNGHEDRHYVVKSVQEVSPYSIPTESVDNTPTLIMYTCVKLAYTAQESMNYPRLLVIATQVS